MRILPISDKFLAYAHKIKTMLIDAGFRATLDDSNDRLNAKIKVAQDAKIPYMLVVGGKDEAAGTVSVRHRTQGDLGAMEFVDFIAHAKTEVLSRGATAIPV
jgi:threonyl-tRNA synthetase